MTPVYQTALAFAQQGLRVFPCGGKDGKEPLTKHGHNDASADPAVLAAWNERLPGANWGLAVPDGMVVVDVDPRNGGALGAVPGLDPASTYSVASGRGDGGVHLYYRVPAGASLPVKLALGVDVRQLGGYVMLPSSIHGVSGAPYTVASAAPIAELPAPLRSRLEARSERRSISTDDIDATRAEVAASKHFGLKAETAVQDVASLEVARAVAALAPIAVQGNRYTALVKAGGWLAWRGWSAESVEQFARAFIDRYGGDNVEHGVRGCLSGMRYPSGYYDLCNMVPVTHKAQFTAQLDAVANPQGQAIAQARNEIGSGMIAALDAARSQEKEGSGGISQFSIEHSASSVVVRGDNGSNHYRVGVAADSGVSGLGVAPADPDGRLAACRDAGGKPPPVNRLVEGIDIVDGRMTLIAGAPNAGKTPTTLTIALAIANGLPVFGRESSRRPVVYVNFEKQHDAAMKQWRVARGLNVPAASVTTFHVGSMGLLLTGKGPANPVADIIAAVQRRAVGEAPVVIIDTYSSATGGLDANASEYAEPLRDFRNALHASVPSPLIVLTHLTKSGSELGHRFDQRAVYGSAMLAGLCEAIIGVYHPDPDDKHSVELFSVRAIGSDMDPIRLRWVDGEDESLKAELVDAQEARQQSARRERVPKSAVNAAAHEKLRAYVRTPVGEDDVEEFTGENVRAIIESVVPDTALLGEAVKYAIDKCVYEGILIPTPANTNKTPNLRRTKRDERSPFNGDFVGRLTAIETIPAEVLAGLPKGA